MKRKNMGEAIVNKQIILRDQSSRSTASSISTNSCVDRRQPLLEYQEYSSRGTVRTRPGSCTTRFAEVVGGTTAECAAVVCCCPCGLINLLILTIYKLPAGLLKKAVRKKRRRKMLKNATGLAPTDRSCSCTEPDRVFKSASTPIAMVNAVSLDKDVLALEEEMWSKFNSSGFLRSASQSSDVIHG